MKNNFFEHLKSKNLKTPPENIDRLILSLAKDKLYQGNEKKSKSWALLLSGGLALASLVVWLQISEPQYPKAMLAESAEMLNEMDDLELLVEVSKWSDKDWDFIMNGET